MIDTHIHLDDEQFADDIADVVARAREAGIERMLVPAVSLPSVETVLAVCRRFPGYAFPMLGLHPEEVRADWREVLDKMETILKDPEISEYSEHSERSEKFENSKTQKLKDSKTPFLAIGEVGLDYYWSREYEREQIDVFARQIEWSIEHRLPLMMHIRKAQNEAVRLLRSYKRDLVCGGVFHCFSGNAHEAAELLDFPGFALGIGGIVTFKKATLPDTLREAVPLDRIVLETDAPYMAPVPVRGRRNESAFIPHIAARLAEVYGVDPSTVAAVTTATAHRIFFKQ